MPTNLVSDAVAQVVSLLRDRFPTGAIVTESAKVVAAARCGSGPDQCWAADFPAVKPYCGLVPVEVIGGPHRHALERGVISEVTIYG
jgi:hypothetical protein